MSKRTWQHPAVPADDTTVAWRSVGQLEDTPGFRDWLEREFPLGASELANDDEQATSRRSFLKLMGASTALAGLGMAACRRPESYIVPYTKAPEWVIPGKATYYASSMPRAHGATPVVVTTFEGRPTKVAPNHLHPAVDRTDAFVQASVLDLYSTSRSRRILRSGKTATRADLNAAIAAIATDKSAKIAFLFGADDSPTRNRLAMELGAKFSAAKFYQYEPLAGELARALGDGVKYVADYALADRIVALDCDFVGLDPQGPVTPFFERRKPEDDGYGGKPEVAKMNRLYAVEAAYSLTGGMADHRLRAAPGQVLSIVGQIARELNLPVAEGVDKVIDPNWLNWIKPLVEDLQAHAGKSMVLAGSRQSAAVHHLVMAVNLALGNIGEGKPLTTVQAANTGLGTLAALKADIESGEVETLVLLTPANPLYDAPADLGFATACAKLKTSIHLGQRADATAHAATWHIPAAHYLESWGDSRGCRGTYTVVQPMILPLYQDCIAETELLLALLSDTGKLIAGEGDKGAPSPAYDAVRKTFATIGGDEETAWKKFLRDGFHAGSAYPIVKIGPADTAIADIADANIVTGRAGEPTKDSLQVVFAADASVYDGRWIDNPWLQEAPDPISKLTWDNAALIAPKTAKALGIYDKIIEPEPVTAVLGVESKYADVGPDGEGQNRKAPMIRLTVNGQSLEIPVLVSFGQAENTVIIPLGYGQGFNKEDELGRNRSNKDHVGLVGVNRGFDAYPLRTGASAYYATGATVKLTGKRYSLALTQEHNAMYGRALAREVSTIDAHDEKGGFDEQLANVKKQGNDAHAPPNLSLYQPMGSATWHPDKDGKAPGFLTDPLHQWGMSIDLSACMGCNACLVACQDACPAKAISFGNLLDKQQSVVGRSKELERNYDLLNYIGTRPRTSYLARVKNPNDKMPGAQFIGKATIHMA